MGKHATTRPGPAFAQRLGDLLLTLLAVAGSLCLVLVVLSLTMNISIMMFKTGSMTPAITAGSIALVKEIPAHELEVGDIATVQRAPGELPVTHRVVEITEISSTGVATFTMKGDGNATADAQPYSASTVQRVFFSVPGLAPLIQKLNSPYVLGGLTLGAAALVSWAFWPREHEGHAAKAPAPAPSNQALLLPVALLSATAVFASATPTGAPTPDAAGNYLRLASEHSPAMSQLSPGASATWTVEVWAEAPETGMIDVGLQVGSVPTDSLPWTLSVASCPVPDTGSPQGCGHGATDVLAAVPAHELAGTAGRELLSFPSTQRYRFLVTATLPAATASEQDIAPLPVHLVARGLGEELTVPPEQREGPPDLAGTGAANLPLLIGAVACTAAGLAATTWRARRQRG